MAIGAEELRSLYHSANSFQHTAPSVLRKTYDSAVLAADTFDRSAFFAKARTAGVDLLLTLPKIGPTTSFHILQYTGVAADTLTITPNAEDQVNGDGLGVSKVYTVDASASSTKLLIFASSNVWHIYSIGTDKINLIPGAGISITGTYPDFTVTVP